MRPSTRHRRSLNSRRAQPGSKRYIPGSFRSWVKCQRARRGARFNEENRIMQETMFIDPQRCIGCRSCVAACRECSTHKGFSMIFVDYIDRSETTATMPTVCMHCEEPTCAMVCPADAIKQNEDGIVMSA